jgi:hypothetical protein
MRTQTVTPKQDIYEQITQAVIEAIEAGVHAYRMPWNSLETPVNATNQKPYRGINSVLLWAIAQKQVILTRNGLRIVNGRISALRCARGSAVQPSCFGSSSMRAGNLKRLTWTRKTKPNPSAAAWPAPITSSMLRKWMVTCVRQFNKFRTPSASRAPNPSFHASQQP